MHAVVLYNVSKSIDKTLIPDAAEQEKRQTAAAERLKKVTGAREITPFEISNVAQGNLPLLGPRRTTREIPMEAFSRVPTCWESIDYVTYASRWKKKFGPAIKDSYVPMAINALSMPTWMIVPIRSKNGTFTKV